MRILVVEDEPKMGDVLQRGLTRAGLSVDVVEHGEDALIRAGATDYQAIVLDAMLPDIDGLDVCRRLRADRIWSPVLMLTARGEVPDRVDGLDAGADAYLTKPFAFDELLARLRALARRGPVERAPVLEVGDLRLDPAGHRAWRGKTQLDLSAKELAMLEIFMRNHG
jgi:two-component system OmpR family response regulator